jgi:hypothetical protein
VEKSREAPPIVSDRCYSDALAQVFDAAASSEEPVRTCVEALVSMAELNPEGARAALWRLQRDWMTLKRLERGLGGDLNQAALRIGATIHLARAELGSADPQLRRRLPELMEWLGRRQLSPTESNPS